MGENTLYLDFPGNEVKPIFGLDQVCAKQNYFQANRLEINISVHKIIC